MIRSLVFTACGFLGATLLPATDAARSSQPNVLMIIADDLNDWVGCLQGHPDVKTPNIDRLAGRGLLFTTAHCAAPVCNPSRIATMAGRRPSSTGAYGNDVVWHQVMPGIATIPQHFKANGYHVVGGGKVYHHPPGFNRRTDWHEYFGQKFDKPDDEMGDAKMVQGEPNGVRPFGVRPRRTPHFQTLNGLTPLAPAARIKAAGEV